MSIEIRPDPVVWFLESRQIAERSEPWEAASCVLATVGANNRPSSRAVLVKEVEPQGFFFYTNYRSRKAAELRVNPWACLCFHWTTLKMQFRVEGETHRATEARSDAYFASRPRVSQLGAWASEQSAALASREALMERVRTLEETYAGREVPRPPHWGGFCLVPQAIEVWIEGEYRLHDRFFYQKSADGWRCTRLAP